MHFLPQTGRELGGLGALEEEEEGAEATPIQKDGKHGQVLGEGGRVSSRWQVDRE